MVGGEDPSAREQARRVYEGSAAVEYWASATDLLPVEEHLFEKYLRDGMDILDLGVGGGRTTPHLSKLADRYVGVDYAQAMVEACRGRFPDLAFVQADAADLSPFEAGSFDAVVFSFGGIDYLTPAENRARCLAECHRVLRDQGILVICRHNPRAVVRLLGQPGQHTSPMSRLKAAAAVPLWAVRRSFRMIPTRAFWSGEGTVVQPPYGFNAPLLPWSRGRREKKHDGIVTEMATPQCVRRELERSGFHVEAVEGTSYPRPTRPLITNWYYYVATRV